MASPSKSPKSKEVVLTSLKTFIELIQTSDGKFLYLCMSGARSVVKSLVLAISANIDILTFDMIDVKYIDVNHQQIHEAMSDVCN